MFEDKRVLELLEKYRALWALGYSMSLMGWDSETYMPRESVVERAVASAELSLLSRRLLLNDIAPMVDRLRDAEGLNDYERGVVRVLSREIDKVRKIPERVQYELAKLRQEASKVWREARPRGDFGAFKPYLSRIVELTRDVAEHVGYEEHPYDALLDFYEEGLKDRDVASMFESIIPTTRKVLDRVLSGGFFPKSHPLENIAYTRESMEAVNREILDILGFPWSRGRLDVSAHPFTSGIGIRDVRITTRYEGVDFRRSMFAVIHEFGHALYDLQIDEGLSMTPIARGASLGVHESQSRFWENIVGRSLEFTRLVKPILDKHLGFTRGYSEGELYKYFNIVRPSLIRVDADEVTYNLHIYLRYKLERLMVAGEVKVEELPELWDNMMEELIGLRPGNPSEGVMQDIHWSIAYIGYFPTYTLGNIIAAQIKAAIEKKLARLSKIIEDSKLGDLRVFLREHIHKYGATYPPKQLLEKSLGEPVNTEYFNIYLEEKMRG